MSNEEETEEQAELFSDMMQTIVNEWDPYINNLKKSLPLNPNELEEVQKAKNEMFTELDYIFCLDKSSPIIALKLKLGRKLRYDHNFFRYYDRDHGIQPARAEQYTTAIILANLEAIEKLHPEEDNEDSDDEADVLDAPSPAIANNEDDHDDAAPLDEPSLVEATLQPQTIAKAAIPTKEGGRTKKKRRSRKKTTLSPNLKKPSPMIMKKILAMKFLMISRILTRRMKRSRKKRIQNSFRILKNPARLPQCRPFHSWQGSSQPTEAVYRSVPKPVPPSSSRQQLRRHQSYRFYYRQSKFVSQVKRKDSPTHAAAAEPGAVYYANEDEEKLAPNKANTYDDAFKFPRANAVRSYLYHSPIT